MHAVRTGLVVAALLAIGCGSSGKKDTDSAAGSGDGGGGATAAGGGDGKGPLTEADCERLLDHWLELYIADKKKTAKPDEVPTEEDIATTRKRMAASTRDKCVGSPRAPYDCSMRADTIEEARLCLEGGER